jgi:hypothetical protein
MLRRLGLVTIVAFTISSCRLTEVALVTVRNETPAELGVKVRLPGDPRFQEDRPLPPAQENVLLKYEEPRSETRPMSALVDGLELMAGACVAKLEGAAVAAAAVRTEHPRRWTVKVTPELLSASGCPTR